jgi:hypothetical protein
MEIKKHDKSYLVELADGAKWRSTGEASRLARGSASHLRPLQRSSNIGG